MGVMDDIRINKQWNNNRINRPTKKRLNQWNNITSKKRKNYQVDNLNPCSISSQTMWNAWRQRRFKRFPEEIVEI